MTSEGLRELIDAGERLNVEFKGEGARPFSDTELLEAIVCLANRPGDEPGWLLVGVEDDGRVTGARPRHAGGITDPWRVQALIANQTRPTLACRTTVVALEGSPVLVIEVPSSANDSSPSPGSASTIERASASTVCAPSSLAELPIR